MEVVFGKNNRSLGQGTLRMHVCLAELRFADGYACVAETFPQHMRPVARVGV